MKKILPMALLLAAFLFTFSAASAQLNFYNGSGCDIKIKASSTYNPNACIGPYCGTATYGIAAGSFFTIPAGMCPSPSPNPSPNFRAVKFGMLNNISGSVDLCFSPVYNFLDCQGVSRTLQIFSGNFAAIN